MPASRSAHPGYPAARARRNQKSKKEKPAADGNGENHVIAESVEGIVHKPFNPKKLEAGLHTRVDRGFLDYANVIRDRAIPKLADGLKPVQRRVLWALHEKDSGKFIKVANIVGHTMQYHPHGDASVMRWWCMQTKRYLIEGREFTATSIRGIRRRRRVISSAV